jgi:hypothetical protein
MPLVYRWLAGLAAAALAVVALPAHPVAVAVVLLVGPGLAIASWLGPATDRATRLFVIIAASLSVAALLSTAAALAHAWSARWLLAALVAASVLAYRRADRDSR